MKMMLKRRASEGKTLPEPASLTRMVHGAPLLSNSLGRAGSPVPSFEQPPSFHLNEVDPLICWGVLLLEKARRVVDSPYVPCSPGHICSCVFVIQSCEAFTLRPELQM